MAQLDRTGSVILPGLRARARWLWLGSIVLGLGGLGMALGPLSSLPFGSDARDSPLHVVIGFVAFLVFGVLGTWLLPRYARQLRGGVVIDRDGVRIPGGSAVPWSRVEAIHARGRRSVTLLVSGRAHGPENRLGEAVFAMRTGYSAVVVPRVRGLGPSELAALLAEGRRRYT